MTGRREGERAGVTLKTKKTDLRKKAEKVVAPTEKAVEKLSPKDAQKLIHELQVHQIELEMQNEELRRTQIELQESQKKYVDLYNFSPAGYFTFDDKGLIRELNAAAANLLGFEKAMLLDRPFRIFAAPEYGDIFTQHRLDVMTSRERRSCELKLVKRDKSSFYASMESIPSANGAGKPNWIRSAVIDITGQKNVEQSLREAQQYSQKLAARILVVQEEERNRVATEIHDNIGQILHVLKARTEQLRRKMGASPENVKNVLIEIDSLIKRLIDESRTTQQRLRPSLLDDLGLVTAIRWHSREFQKNHEDIHIETQLQIRDEDVPHSLSIIIYRILQEALNNVVKHSQGNNVKVSLKQTKDRLELIVQDNGRGLNLTHELSCRDVTHGFGLKTMRERAELSNGAFNLESSPGQGTTIRASWPYPSPRS